MKKDLYKKIFAPSDCLSQPLLVGYLKGTLNEQETHKVEEHLVDCDLCTEALDGLMLIKNESVLGAVSNDVKKVSQGKENKRRIAPIGIWIAAAASVAVIIASVIAIKTITSENNRQLAVREVKIPVTKDSLKSIEKQEEIKVNSEEISKTENLIVEENLQTADKTIKTFRSQAPAQPETNSQIVSVEENDNELITMEDKLEQDAFFSSENKAEELAFRTQTLKTNSPAEPAAGNISSDVKTFSSKAVSSEKINDQSKNSESVAYVHDLKIIDYSKKNEENILEPPANNTEAKFATPEVKQEVAAALPAESSTYKEIISPALEAYQQKKYSLVISLLNNVLKENPSDLNARFYSGMANHHLQNYSKSLEFFQSIIKKNDNTFFEEAKYYTALNYIYLNEISKAKNLLKEIINMDSFYRQRAEEKLKEISN